MDGPNGVGKSSLIAAIHRHLVGKGYRVYLTKEITNSALGKFIRDHHREYYGKTLAFLIAADRQHHIEQEIMPALESHDIVITDRYVDSSLVFQRLDGVSLNFLWKINGDFLKPDLSIILMATASVISSRMALRKTFDRFEQSFGSKRGISSIRECRNVHGKEGIQRY